MWVIFAFGSAFFAGVTAILAKIGIRDTDSHLATALRTVVVLLFSWLLVFLEGSYHGIGEIPGRSLLFLCLSGFTTGASWLCYFRALQLGNVNKVVPVDKSSVILSMLMAWLFLGEQADIPAIAAMVLIGTGTYLMIEKKVTEERREDKRWFLYAAGSAVFASLTSILGKVGITGVESNLGTALRTVIVLLMAWFLVFWQKKQKDLSKIDRKSWVYIGLSGLATGLSWLCYYRALQDGLVSVVVPVDKLSILVTAAAARIVLKEKLSKKGLTGLFLITGGTLLLLL